MEPFIISVARERGAPQHEADDQTLRGELRACEDSPPRERHGGLGLMPLTPLPPAGFLGGL